MNFKRHHYRSKTMKKCMMCGSQKRAFGKKIREKLIDKYFRIIKNAI